MTIQKKDYSNFTIDDATHLLECRHAIGKNGYDYYMKCLVLGTTKSNKTKILVFGNRYWKGAEHTKRIRYVETRKLQEICKVNNS